jgi:hypothetical protein
MLTITFDESYKESRRLRLDRENVSQTIVGFLCGNFFDEATQNESGLYNDDISVLQAVYDYFPLTYELPLRNGKAVLLAQANVEIEQISNNSWKATVVYDIPKSGQDQPSGSGPNSSEEEPTENFTQISVNFSPATKKLNTSLAVTSCERNKNLPYIGGPCSYPVGNPAPIGHTENGVEGADVYVKEFSFNITVYMDPERLTYSYVRRLSRMYLSLNREVFFGFPPGSVLFTDCTFSGDLYQVIPVTFGFQVSNNFKFSDTEPTTTPDPSSAPEDYYEIYNEPDFFGTDVLSGWDIVDYRYAPVASTDNKMLIQRPVLRLTHSVYLYTSFSHFEI